jgi:CMP-N-acetylneuraminic acid synthetase
MTTSATLPKHIAVIPARAGSKRLKNKNLKILHHKSLIEWTILAAIEANVFERIIVSTDSEQIAAVAREAGAEVTTLRPASLACDASTPVEVALDLLNSLEPEHYTTLTWLQPTSPLRTAEDIVAAHQVFKKHQADCVISVCECEHSPLWAGQLSEDNNMRDFIETKINTQRSQDLPNYFRLNGAIYIVDTKKFIQQQSFFLSGDKSFAYKMPQQRSIDIDTQWDFDLAEFILSRGH